MPREPLSTKPLKPINPERLETFGKEYTSQLMKAVIEKPHEYVWPAEHAPIVARKMIEAFARGSYNKDGYAIKLTCKALGIPYTYRSINNFLRSEAL